MSPQQAWLQLYTSASTLLNIADRADLCLQMDDDVTEAWCRAFDHIEEALAILKEPTMPDWRNDPTRTSTRQDDEKRLLVHLIRNRRRRGVLSHNEAADILEDMGIDPAGVLRLLADFIPSGDTPPQSLGEYLEREAKA